MSGYEGHTPGPWTWEALDGTDEDGKPTPPQFLIDAHDLVVILAGENEADARLIAAAPSLLTRVEALETLLRRVEWVQQRWNGAPSCPSCGGYRHLEGHDPGCELLRLLNNGNGEGT